MYIRSKNFKNKDGSTREYLYLVDSEWKNGKNVQKHVACLGRVDEPESKNNLEKIANSIAKYIHKEKLIKSAEEQLELNFAKEIGPAILFKHLWKQLSIDKILKRCFKVYPKKNEYANAIYLMVLNRLCEPQSKIGVSRWIDLIHDAATEGMKKNYFYESLDALIGAKNDIEESVFDNMKTLFNFQVDLVFLDSTSFVYYGGKYAESAAYGYSKDHRGDLKQFIMAMVVTKEGYPISHQIFEGNKVDKKLFIPFISDVQRRFNLRNIILVQDSGFYSQDIEKWIVNEGLQYIVKAPLSGTRKHYARTTECVVEILVDDDTGETLVFADERDQGGIREVLVLSTKRQYAEKLTREAILEKLRQKIEHSSPKEFVSNRGYKRFLKKPDEQFQIDEAKVEESALLDGKFVLKTNSDLPLKDVVLGYKQLAVIERSFRYLKNPLEVAPLYHWKENRIRAHVFICVLAFLLEMVLLKDLRPVQKKLNYPKFLAELRKLRIVELKNGDNTYLIRNEIEGDPWKVFQRLNIPLPNRVLEVIKTT